MLQNLLQNKGVGLYYAGYNNASQSMSGCQPINAMFSNIYKTNFHLHKLKVSLSIVYNWILFKIIL